MRMCLGVDIGGTKLEAVVLDANAPTRAVARRRISTERELGYQTIVERTARLVREVAAEAGIDALTVPIGVGLPGGVTRVGGLIKNSNTVCLNGRPFRQDLAEQLGRPVAFDNDANCFALAEALLGAGAPHRSGVVFGVIVGTGVGGGLVVRGELWSGLQGIAGEWGHHPIDTSSTRRCYCGSFGCLELYASGPAIEAMYFDRAAQHLDTAAIASRRLEDEAAGEVIEGLLDALARGLGDVINVVDPSAIVFGGGLSNLACLYDELPTRTKRHVFNDELITPFLKNLLGDSAGVFGAALIGAASQRG